MPNPNPPIQQRLRTCISRADAVELRRLRKHFGFRSDYHLFQASVLLVLRLLQRAEQREIDQIDEATIEETFTALSEWELPELGARPRRGTRGAELLHLLFGREDSTTESSTCMQTLPKSHPDARSWYTHFVKLHYNRLYSLFASRSQRPTSDGMTPLDLFHETLLRLQIPPASIIDWPSYESWALEKFHQMPVHPDHDGDAVSTQASVS